MKPEELVDIVSRMEPEALRDFCALAGRVFAAKAEAIYDQNPEENGDLAQPYADLADMFNEGAMVFDAPMEAPLDQSTVVEEAPVTVTAAVNQPKTGWGKY
mgnify:CR=1 FL=1